MKLYNLTITVADKKKGHAVTHYKVAAFDDLDAITKMVKRFKGKQILTFSINKISDVPDGDEIFIIPFQTPIQPEDWMNKRMFVIHPDYKEKSKLNWDKVFNRPKTIKKAVAIRKKKQLTREQAERMLNILQKMQGGDN